MKISFVEVKETIMRLTLIEVMFFTKTPAEQKGPENGPNSALNKSKNIGIANQMNICKKASFHFYVFSIIEMKYCTFEEQM